MDTRFAVVIVTYNRLPLLQECIECVLNQTVKAKEIIIIDNASSDGTQEYLKTLDKLERPQIVIDRSSINEGGAEGFYRGINAFLQSECDWVVLIDDDAMLCAHYLEQLNCYINKMPDIKAFSGTVLTDGQIITEHRRRLLNQQVIIEKKVDLEEYELPYFTYDLTSFCGIAFAKSIIEKTGLPYKDFFIWYDDTEYSFRVRKYSRIVNINCISLNHKTIIDNDYSSEYEKRLNWKRYYGYRNKTFTLIKYGYKNYILRQNREALKKVAIIFLFGKVPKSIAFYNLKLTWRGIRDGILGRLGKNKFYLP